MRGDDSFAWDHVAIWSSVAPAQRVCVHFHNFQLHSGKLNTAFSERNPCSYGTKVKGRLVDLTLIEIFLFQVCILTKIKLSAQSAPHLRAQVHLTYVY